MESTPRAPQIGDTVFILARMKSGRFTELSGVIEGVLTDYVYFGLESINLTPGNKDDVLLLESKIWPKRAGKLLRVGVPLNDLKPFDGKLDKDAPCWEVRV
jgi:hypothetical protein